jgi:nitrogen fixation NifU-like protein
MSLLSELYQEVILDHNRRPRNYGELADATSEAEGYNPLCGDKVKVYLKKDGDVIQQVAFEGTGCAISTASASIMTEVLKGKTVAEAEELFRKFRSLVTGKSGTNSEDGELEQLMVFNRLSEYPVRVKCATLVWHALRSALDGTGDEATTE